MKYRTARITEAVTGKIEVRSAVNGMGPRRIAAKRPAQGAIYDNGPQMLD
ncbi:MAG: hypothetical protein HY736_11515 [Verrucomicrobia bacterium]|nr:hypothetical protein [Verrucomicrobiota bacterium]